MCLHVSSALCVALICLHYLQLCVQVPTESVVSCCLQLVACPALSSSHPAVEEVTDLVSATRFFLLDATGISDCCAPAPSLVNLSAVSYFCTLRWDELHSRAICYWVYIFLILWVLQMQFWNHSCCNTIQWYFILIHQNLHVCHIQYWYVSSSSSSCTTPINADGHGIYMVIQYSHWYCL